MSENVKVNYYSVVPAEVKYNNELTIENFNVFSKNDVACLCFIAKYKSFPRPYVRTTMYIEKIEDNWKVLHVHCSFEPEK